MRCIYCKGKTVKAVFKITTKGRKQRLQCVECGKTFCPADEVKK